jgi:hypothetical protein
MSSKTYIRFDGYCVKAVRVLTSHSEIPLNARIVNDGWLTGRHTHHENDPHGTVLHEEGVGYYFLRLGGN